MLSGFRYEVRQKTTHETLVKIPFTYVMKTNTKWNLAALTVRWYPRNSGDDKYGDYYRVKHRLQEDEQWIVTPFTHFNEEITIYRLYSNEIYEIRIEINGGNQFVQSESHLIKTPKYFSL